MALRQLPIDHAALVVESTEGDFPHARRRGVRLACCTCTTCCFTLLLGGIGGITGLVLGVASVNRYALEIENPVASVVVNILWFVAVVIAYTAVGILIGAGAGFAIDWLVSK